MANETQGFVPLAPETLMKIRQLELRAKTVVEGFMSGLHRSPYHGFSVEFTDYRPYSPGDDLRYLDWKQVARRDRQYIKRFEDETNLRCYLLLDMSRSMSFGSTSYTKADYARTLAATLAWFFNRQRDAVGLMTFGESIHDVVPPRYRAGHLRRLMLALEHAQPDSATDVEGPLEQIARTVSRRALVILISDFLAPIDSLEQKLGYLRARGHQVTLMRVLDPTEIEFDFTKASMFQDVETNRQIYVDPASVRESYLQQFSEHAEQLAAICQRSGIDLHTLRIDQPVEDALVALVQSRVGTAMGMGQRRNPVVGGGAS